jgi:hypothetical protein
MVPFSRDEWFIGREDIIAEISEHRTALQTHTRVALVGLGGVGLVVLQNFFLDSSTNRSLGNRRLRSSMHTESERRRRTS